MRQGPEIRILSLRPKYQRLTALSFRPLGTVSWRPPINPLHSPLYIIESVRRGGLKIWVMVQVYAFQSLD